MNWPVSLLLLHLLFAINAAGAPVVGMGAAAGGCPAMPHLPRSMRSNATIPLAVKQALLAFLRNTTLAPNGPSATAVAGSLVFGNDAFLFAEGFGSKKAPAVPVTPDTPFRVASVSKTFVVEGLLREVEAGTLRSLDDEARSALNAPDFYVANPFGDGQPTLRQIASQMSGMPREVPGPS